MTVLTIDIETIPTQKNDIKNIVTSNVKHPGTIKVEASIAKWEKEKRHQAEEDAILKTSFSGLYGEIICIGFAIDDGKVEVISRKPDETERDMLFRWWYFIGNLVGRTTFPMWVGHNICEFDLRFLFLRSMINKVKPSLMVPYNQKPWGKDVFDTLYEVMGNNKAGGSLDAITKVLGFAGKDGMTGADVWPEYQKGNIEKIAQYCIGDVELTRDLYKRLNFVDSIKTME